MNIYFVVYHKVHAVWYVNYHFSVIIYHHCTFATVEVGNGG